MVAFLDSWLDFTVIGLTAPIASGCSSLADFLSGETFETDFKRILTVEIKSNKEDIDQLYINIANERNIYESKIKEDKYIEELFAIKYDGVSQELNRRIKRALEVRQYLNVLSTQTSFKFTKISLSDLIIKKCIDFSSDKKFKNLPFDFTSVIDSFDMKKTLGKFNYIIENKQYSAFKEEKLCIEITEMLSQFRKIKNILRETMEYSQYVQIMQNIGNNLRRCGNPYDELSTFENNLDVLVIEANDLIKFYRHKASPNSLFMVESFRNPSEIQFFRNRYARFFLVSIDADLEKRRTSQYFSEQREAFDRGANDRLPYVQKVSQCVHLSDINIYNEEYDRDSLVKKFLRYLALIIQPGCIPPKMTEVLMHEAYSVSLRSNCISRQVGAVITNAEGYVLSIGWNDVGSGQLGCGLLMKSDFYNEGSPCEIWEPLVEKLNSNGVLDDINDSESFCFKDKISQSKIIDQILKIEKNFKLPVSYERTDEAIVEKVKQESFKEIINKLNIKRLEYARALHAEENALLQLARNGSQGVYGGTIYTTTFPCELCSKKIYQAGLRKIVYTEPYPDAESIRFLRDGTRYLQLIPFEGVKSFSFFKLFKAEIDKKERQKIRSSKVINSLTFDPV